MFRRKILAILALGAFALAGPLSASSDSGYAPSWNLVGTDSVYGDGDTIMIAPRNDSRVNLLLLVRDREGLASQPGNYADYGPYASQDHIFFKWFGLSASYFDSAGGDRADLHNITYGGSRCGSLEQGDEAFAAAVNSNRQLTLQERTGLLAGRSELARICEAINPGSSYFGSDQEEPSVPLPDDWGFETETQAGRSFYVYLVASAQFYAGNWDQSRTLFKILTESRDDWVKETASYMLARVELNAAIDGKFDRWGFYDHESDFGREEALAGEVALENYLEQFPDGAYADSARGLVRRAYWLAEKRDEMVREYSRLLGATPPDAPEIVRLINEIDSKVLMARGMEGASLPPLLLAADNLMRMRYRAGDEWQPEDALGAEELAAQEPMFEGHEELFAHLQAAHAFHVRGDARAVLELIPAYPDQASFSALEFSRQALRGMALEQLGDPAAESFWLAMLDGSTGLHQRPLVELALALNYERSGRLAKVFERGSPVRETDIRQRLLRNVAGPEVLRQTVHDASRPPAEREIALHTLLMKDLMRGRYADFLADVDAVPSGAATQNYDPETYVPVTPLGLFTNGRWSSVYECPALVETVRALARDPESVQGRLCLGDFYRLNGFDYDFSTYSSAYLRDASQLGGTPDLFPGEITPRSEFYSDIMDDPSASRNERAYALNRAVRCYAPAGHSDCGGEEVDVEQRRAWFERLKREYGDTQWARDLEYYW